MKYTIFLIALLPFFQQSCSENDALNPDLTGYTWTLIEVNDQVVPDSVVATLYLNPDSKAGNGSGGCNTYGVDFSLTGSGLQFSNLVSTEMACLGIMNWETDFFNALSATEEFQIKDQKLKLLENGTIIAVLE